MAIEFEAFDGPADSIKKPDDQFSVQVIKKVVSFEKEDPVSKPEASVADLAVLISDGFNKLGKLISQQNRSSPPNINQQKCWKCRKFGHSVSNCRDQTETIYTKQNIEVVSGPLNSQGLSSSPKSQPK